MASSTHPEDDDLMVQDLQKLYDNLHSLPTEVLLKIFSYLPGSCLIQLDSSNVKRIREISRCINHMDFEGWCTISPQQLENSIAIKCHIITELNFNNVLSIKPAVMLEAIILCKNIMVLSVKHCGLHFPAIFKIFEKCRNIEAFSWTCRWKPFNSANLNAYSTTNIRKLDIDFSEDSFLYWFDMFILRRCPLLEELRLFFRRETNPGYFENFFRNEDKSCPLLKLHSLTVQWDAIPLEKSSYSKFTQLFKRLILTLCESKSPNTAWKKLWVQPILTCFKNNSPTSLPADASIKALSSPSLICDLTNVNGISMMGIVSPEDTDIIKQVGGKNLTHLLRIPAIEMNKLDHRSLALNIGLSHLARLLRDCTNITHLDFRKVHFVKDCVKKITACALISLKGLKKLILSSCAISGQRPSNCCAESYFKKMIQKKSKGHSVPQEEFFAQMVASCNLVEAFEISGCVNCKESYLMDEGLSAVHLWPKLKSLVIENVASLQRCSFLQKIPEGCQNFQSLQLLNVGSKEVCKFARYVIPILENAKQLTFLGICQPTFDNNDDTFWTAVSCATNLKGICINVNIRRYLLTKTIAYEVSKLQKLQFFHFNSDKTEDKIHLEKLQKELRNVLKEQKRGYDLDIAVYPGECMATSHRCIYDSSVERHLRNS